VSRMYACTHDSAAMQGMRKQFKNELIDTYLLAFVVNKIKISFSLFIVLS
jgi:hypothetical protein